MNFQRSNYDNYVYILKRDEEVLLYLLLNVDDILLASSIMDQIDKLKAMFSFEFEMKELGKAKRIPRMDINITRSKGELFLSQQGYMKKVVEKFRMHESKLVSTPSGQHDKFSTKDAPNSDEEREKMALIPYSNGVGSIMYDMVYSKPDLAYAVNMVSRFMTNPRPKHWEALKWVFRYLNGSLSSGLKFKRKMKSEEPI